MLKRSLVILIAVPSVLASASPALACAGLIGRNGSVSLLRTSTLAAYHDGIEHYITSFEFNGAGGEFGSIVPLPGVPTKVERGGKWTLQRLVRETQPKPVTFALSAIEQRAASAQVLLETRIDALDITILEGGSAEVGKWARDHGYLLSPDTPEVLDFYARRSPIFMAARFNAEEAEKRGEQVGEGTPIHLTIPVDQPWVPLRILALGKKPADPVQADVYLLTDRTPEFLPEPGKGMFLGYSAPASKRLISDLRSDDGMNWVPGEMWLTQLTIDTAARELTYDLAVDASGAGKPSRVAAGLELYEEAAPQPETTNALALIALGLAGILTAAAVALWAEIPKIA
jgi:hypothetical protein